jgi:hypothetical protein
MASTAQRARPQGPRLLEKPMLLVRTRRDIAELIGCVWLAVEIVRLVRSRFEKPKPASPPWDHPDSPFRPRP